MVRSGFSTPFWHASWTASGILKDAFPFLYSASLLQDVLVAAIEGWSDVVWWWGDLSVHDNLLLHHDYLAEKLLLDEVLRPVQPCARRTDSIAWKFDKSLIFSVGNCHEIINFKSIPFGPTDRFNLALEKVWKEEVFVKIKAFRWQCFINILPTYDSLVARGMFPSPNISCVFCSSRVEYSLHSILLCHITGLVWKDVVKASQTDTEA